MNRLFIICITILLIGCKNEKTRPVNISQIGWTLPVPLDISFRDSAFDKNGILKDSLWERDPGSKERVEILWIKNDQDNYFNAIVYADSSNPKAWKKKTIDDSRYYFSIIASTPDMRVMDSSIAVKTFDGVEFQEEFINYRKKRTDMSWSYQYSRRYKNYAIYINVRFTDKKIGKRYLKMIRNSTFEK